MNDVSEKEIAEVCKWLGVPPQPDGTWLLTPDLAWRIQEGLVQRTSGLRLTQVGEWYLVGIFQRDGSLIHPPTTGRLDEALITAALELKRAVEGGETRE